MSAAQRDRSYNTEIPGTLGMLWSEAGLPDASFGRGPPTDARNFNLVPAEPGKAQ